MIRRLPVEFADTARSDLVDLTEYVALASGSYRVAAKFVARVEARCEKIANAPRGGRVSNDIRPGLRTVPFEHSAVIAYTIDNDVIRIINVFYGGRDFEALLRDRSATTDD